MAQSVWPIHVRLCAPFIILPVAAMHACATTCQPLWASAPEALPAIGLHAVCRQDGTHRPLTGLAASVGDSLSEPWRGNEPICRSSIRTREGRLPLSWIWASIRQVSSSTSTLLRACEASNTRAACGGGPTPVFPTLQRAHVGGQAATLR
jgi:hypothetical protein